MRGFLRRRCLDRAGVQKAATEALRRSLFCRIQKNSGKQKVFLQKAADDVIINPEDAAGTVIGREESETPLR